jgi:hypothetical protein
VIIRVEVRDALKTAIVAALPDLPNKAVAKGFDAPESHYEQVWIGGARGAIDYEVFANDTTPHDDQFVIDVLVLAAKPSQTQAAAETRAQDLINAIVLAANAAAIVAIDVTVANVSRAYVIDASLASIDGPHTQPRDEMWIGYGAVEVAVHTRSIYL